MKLTARGLRDWLLSDWHGNGMRLLLGIFIYQFVIWFDSYWVDKTKAVVTGTMAATFAVEWFAKLPAWFRRIAGIVAAITVSARILDPEPVKGIDGSFTGLFFSSLEFVFRLTPFIWFALGAWAIYIALDRYITTKWRLFFLLFISIFVLCVVDSFSSFVFWEQVAVIIACGLLMLVIHHLQQLKAKDPEGYEHLMNYPAPITVMVVTIISASIALGVLAPNIKPIIMDPYTAWKASKGEAVPALGKGTGWFQETTVRSSASGYSRNDSSLGGAFNFDYTPVFSVNTNRRSYWRGETRSYYTGSGWEATPRELSSELVPIEGKGMSLASPYSAGQLGTVEVTQIVRMYTDAPFPVLFAAPFPQSVQLVEEPPATEAPALFWQGEQGVMRWVEEQEVPYPKVYSVTSQMPVVDEKKLETARPVHHPEEWADYLQVPSSVPERVLQLARKVTDASVSPYDKAKAIKAYLSRSYPYTNTPDVSKGKSADFVDRFLFEIQEGYCDYYSTAMVIMARSVGLPARWVKGYVPGQSEMELIYRQYLPGEPKDPDGPGTYTVRNADAHSWVEVYFEGFGWIPFEPTAGFALPIAETEQEVPVVLPPDLEETTETLQARTEASGDLGFLWRAAGAAALLAGIAAWLAWRFQWVAFIRTRALRKSANYNTKFLGEMERLLYRLRRKGLHWSDDETVREMMRRWMEEHAGLEKDLQQLLHAFEKAKYSKAGLSEEEYRDAEQGIRKLRESLR